jgi:hypothetical protein
LYFHYWGAFVLDPFKINQNEGVGVNLMSGQNFFSQQIIIFFHKDIDDDDYKDECYDFRDELFNFEQILRMSRDN